MFEFIIVAAVTLAGIWGLVFLIGVPIAIISSWNNGDKIVEAETALKARFGEGDYAYSLYGPSCIGVSFERELVVIGSSVEDVKTYPFAAVLACSIELDDRIVTTTTGKSSSGNGGRLAGATAGAVLLGPVGLLLGGVTGGPQKNKSSSIQTRLIKTVKIVIRVSDHNAPLHTAYFLKLRGEGYQADSEGIIKPIMERVSHFNALLSNIVDNNQGRSPQQAA